MHTPEIQIPQAGRRFGRYSDEFKRQIIAACLEPGISTAAIALSNGINANLARRWVTESDLSRPQLDALVLGLPWSRIGKGGIITVV